MNAPDVKEKRKAWGETITKYLPEKLVFLDESGVNTDMTRIYGRTMGGERPVICMDEKPVKIFASARKSLRSKDGRTTYEDHEYIRNGTAAIFLFTEPLNGGVIQMLRNTVQEKTGQSKSNSCSRNNIQMQKKLSLLWII